MFSTAPSEISQAFCAAGYMVARMLGSVPVLADAVVEQLCRGCDRVADAHQPLGARSEQEAAFLSANVWRAIWPAERRASLCGHEQTLPAVLHQIQT